MILQEKILVDTKRPASAHYKRALVTKLGGPEVLQIVEDERPQPAANEARVRIIAAGLSFADITMREGVHLEKPHIPFTPGWDLVGIVDQLGPKANRLQIGELVVAMPVIGGQAEYICLPESEFVPVPPGVDPLDALCIVFNYLTAYQMMYRSAQLKPGQRVLIHAAGGGIGTALLQLGRLMDVEMYGTASERSHDLVRSLGATPIDYRHVDFVQEIRRLTGDGVDVVFDGIGGKHIWRSRGALKAPGKVIAYGLMTSISGGQLSSGIRRLRGIGIIALGIASSCVMPGRKKIVPYSIQRLKRSKPEWFREDIGHLFDLVRQGKIKPIIAAKIPLVEIQRAYDLLERKGVQGKIVLICDQAMN